MGLVINVITALGSGIWWLVQKFFPYLVKKFGVAAVKFAIQKSISYLLVATTIAFYVAVIIFLNETFTQFREFMTLFSNPSQYVQGQEATKYFSCFLNLLHVSGIASGFNSAFNFGISVFVFFFFRGMYRITISTLKILSDEIQKSLKLI